MGTLSFGVTAGGKAAGVGPMLRHWFDAWLLGEQAALAGQAPVRLFVMGANVWRDEREWPLARACPTRYYLHAGGLLSAEPPAHEAPATYLYDPADPARTLGGATLMEGHAVNLHAGPPDQRPVEARHRDPTDLPARHWVSSRRMSARPARPDQRAILS